ncbi:hypothetical protein B0H14DRAFT_3731375 [Mycena olivaceomarginata]|nr:hypothetical protein B0H14DRAFT_3731375 [Mycena olivaceomarginata]
MSLKSLPSPPFPSSPSSSSSPPWPKKELFDRTMGPHIPGIKTATLIKRDTWDSREEAMAWLEGKKPWKRWDARVLGLFVVCAVYPSLLAPLHTPDGVTLKFEELDRIAGKVPVHLVWASRSELVPKVLQDDLSEGPEGKRRFASVTRLEGRHLVLSRFSSSLPRPTCPVPALV